MEKALDFISTHMEDRFSWPEPSFHGKPFDLLEVESKIDKLEARYIRLTDVEPLPWDDAGLFGYSPTAYAKFYPSEIEVIEYRKELVTNE